MLSKKALSVLAMLSVFSLTACSHEVVIPVDTSTTPSDTTSSSTSTSRADKVSYDEFLGIEKDREEKVYDVLGLLYFGSQKELEKNRDGVLSLVGSKSNDFVDFIFPANLPSTATPPNFSCSILGNSVASGSNPDDTDELIPIDIPNNLGYSNYVIAGPHFNNSYTYKFTVGCGFDQKYIYHNAWDAYDDGETRTRTWTVMVPLVATFTFKPDSSEIESVTYEVFNDGTEEFLED